MCRRCRDAHLECHGFDRALLQIARRASRPPARTPDRPSQSLLPAAHNRGGTGPCASVQTKLDDVQQGSVDYLHFPHCKSPCFTSPLGVHPDSHDRGLFEIFRSTTIRAVTGDYNANFWALDVVLAAQTHPAIWTSCLALAAAHHRLRYTAGSSEADVGSAESYYARSMTHYSRSIQYLLQITTKPCLTYQDKQTVVLISCMQFGLCCMLRLTKPGLVHASNAIRLFYHWKLWEQANASPFLTSASSSSNSDGSKGGLVDAYMLAVHVTSSIEPIFDGRQGVQPPRLYDSICLANQPRSNTIRAFCKHLPRQRRIYPLHYAPVDRSGTAFEDERLPGLPTSMQSSVEDPLFKLHRCWEWNYGQYTSEVPQIDADRQTSAWLALLDAADELQAQRHNRTAGDPGSSAFPLLPSFSYYKGPIDIVRLTGQCCRIRAVRQHALQIMDKWWRHGSTIWNTTLASQIVQAVDAFESSPVEGGAACLCVVDRPPCRLHRVDDIEMVIEGEAPTMLILRNAEQCRLGLLGVATTVSQYLE